MIACSAEEISREESTSAAAFPTDQQGLPIYSKLPKEVRDTAASVRASCKEAFHDEEPPKFDEWQGIHIVDLKGDGSDDIVVDHEHLCDSRMAGFNCSNRACELEIYKQVGKDKWRKVFSEELYDKHLVIDWETNRLQMMIASIYYGDPRCQPDPKKEYTSGKSCNLIVTYRNGKWNWQKIPQRCCSAIKMTGVGQTRSFGDVGSMSGLPESGHGWALLSTRPSAANWHIRRERQESTLGEI